MKILMLLAEGFEELEFVAPFDIFKRAGCEVTVASITKDLTVRSVRSLSIVADTTLDLLTQHLFDVVFLPGGGPGTANLRESQIVKNFIQAHTQKGMEIAAICAAPLVLADAGILKGKMATCFPTCQAELVDQGAKLSQERVVQDGSIWTSRGAGSASEFAFALVTHWLGSEKSETIRTQMQF